MKKCNILIPIGCRSDEGLSAPVIRRLREQDWCECTTIPLSPANYLESYKIIEKHLSLMHPQYDLVIITGDRIEMMACAEACFLNHIKIAHFYAGIIDYSFVLFDDIHRHSITLMSDIAFCEDQQSAVRVKELWSTIGRFKNLVGNDTKSLERKNIYNVGISHMDDLELDESLVPKEDCGSCKDLIDCNNTDKGCVVPYDLILINPTTTIKTNHTEELKKIINPNRLNIFIAPNPDKQNPSFHADLIQKKDKFYYDGLPRPQFLGLLKRCQRFITNSSCAYYEAPYFLRPEQIIQIGLRNKNRSTPKKLETGASDKIVNILKKWWQNEQL